MAFCFVSCKKEYTQHDTILNAEQLVDSFPAKALILLDSIPNHENFSTSDNAAWCLQYTRTLYKLDSAIYSDSLISISIQYYKGTSLYKYSGLSYYLLGCIESNLNETDRALQAFKMSEYQLLKTKEDNLLGLTYYKIGYLYSLDEYFDKSIENFKKSSYYFHRAKNMKNEAYAFRELAISTDNAKRNIDSVLSYFHRAKTLSLQVNDSANYYDTNFYLAITLLTKTQDYQKAKKYLLDVYRYNKCDPYYYNKISLVYSNMNQADSALYYFHKALPDTLTIYAKVATYIAGAYAEKANGNYAKAFEYFSLYDNNRNKVIAETKRNQHYRIDQLSMLNDKMIENDGLKIDNRNKVIYIEVLVIILLLVIVVMLRIQAKRFKEHDDLLNEKQKLMIEIKHKRFLIFSRLKNRIEITLRFRQMSEKIQFANEKQHLFMTGILDQFVLTEVAWQSCIDGVNFIYNNQLERLSVLHPAITQADKIVMSLISLQLDITDSCIVLGLTKNTMYRRRNTIKERLGLDKSIDLEVWLLSQMAQNLTDEEQNELTKKIVHKDLY
ncbi:MAG: hypothetical protein WCG93_06120 [Paludibacter sp.]